MNAAPLPDGMDELVRFLVDKTGMEYLARQRATTEAAIRHAMASQGLHDAAHFRARLARDGSVFDALIDALTVRETYFFRDPRHFTLVRDTLVPALLDTHGPSHRLRLWSAGCSSGEEPYSLAILFREMGMAAGVQIFATDISSTALEKARAATYSAWSIRRASFEGYERYFREQDGAFVLDDVIRERVHLEHHNLLGECPPSFAGGDKPLDIILCRNVMIYFGHEAICRLAQRLYQWLHEGGWLVAGPSDPPLAPYAPFEVLSTDLGLVYRRPLPSSTIFIGLTGSEPTSTVATEPSVNAGAVSEEPPSVDDEGPSPPPSEARRALLSLRAAHHALARGEYGVLLDESAALLETSEGSRLLVRARANVHGSDGALEVLSQALARHSLCAALHHLHALVLSDAGRLDDAIRAARRALFLDDSLAMVHFALGAILSRKGDVAGAVRAYQNARALCLRLPGDAIVELSEGEPARAVAEAAEAQLRRLERAARSKT